MSKTKIEWTEYKWNFVTGCNKISAGCKECYAENFARRFWGERKFTDVQIDESKLMLPLHWKKPRKIFVNSMSDLFHEKVPFEIIEKAWEIMATNPRHTYQILTKRPERMLEFCQYMSEKIHEAGYEKRNGWAFHIPNFIWMGVSVENQKAADERRNYLEQIPAEMKWVSYEPALEEVNWNGWEFIDWIVMGAESGHARRACDHDWFTVTINWAKQWDIIPFVKQMQMAGKVVKDCNLFPKHLQVREYPKVAS